MDKILVANRGEIATRVFRAATELGLHTVAVFSWEDRYSLHRFKADESYLLDQSKGPIGAYLDINTIIKTALEAGADAIHPGYGFLAENPDFAETCRKNGLIFIGPDPQVMRKFGNKITAREIAKKAGIPIIPASPPLNDLEQALKEAKKIGYPLMLKASWGGGGRGMRVIFDAKGLKKEFDSARSEAVSGFGRDEVYLEKLITNARHVEVQILGDAKGNLVHLFERDCSVQRRNQKIIERAPAPYLNSKQRKEVCSLAMMLCRKVGYSNAGTVEFLLEGETGNFYFIEVNPRLQVEHTVTEEVTGIDIVKAQIKIAGGQTLKECGIPAQSKIKLNGHALQARITTEDPKNNFMPNYGRLKVYRGAEGFGIRRDGGNAYTGAIVTPYYDSLLEKLTSWAPTPEEAIQRMNRALRETRIRGVKTNIAFLENLINHEKFRTMTYNTRFIDETPDLFRFKKRRDRASKLLNFIGKIIVDGNPEVKGRPRPAGFDVPIVPEVSGIGRPPAGHKNFLDKVGPKNFSKWMLEQTKPLITDTTFRDAHQSLLATRIRTHDLLKIAPAYAHLMTDLFSVECWGGATFDVAMRFLKEDPWERLIALRAALPNHILQMLFRGANAVGYSNYPDNVVRHFVTQSKKAGIDLFRIFDANNWVENMKVAIEAVLEEGGLCEAAICYTGDLLDPNRSKFNLPYYLRLARELAALDVHIIAIKDMAGLCRPEAAKILVKAIKEETGLPVHFHTHDTAGSAVASVLVAIEAGADAVDTAMDSMSGLTSQPSLGAIVAALQNSDKEINLELKNIEKISRFWEATRHNYGAFESKIRAGTADVYQHEMPGGQYTNLREQARSLGLADRWPEVSKAYTQVNEMFGDIVKVTPTSKVVGDMALMMVTSGVTREQVADPNHDTAFPESVVAFFRGDLGQPPGGLPEALQRKVLGGQAPYTERPGAFVAPANLEKKRQECKKKIGREVSEYDLASYLMYPAVFLEFAEHRALYSDISGLETPVFFYGPEPNEEISVDIERGKTLFIRYLAQGELNEKGKIAVFFELNGQARVATIEPEAAGEDQTRVVADLDNQDHIWAPMPALIAAIEVEKDQKVAEGEVLIVLEAMKIETLVRAPKAGKIAKIVALKGATVETNDLLLVLE
ncbi:MAG: pyruvate carboxylase [Proteobacteria bacterium]|nr:pyruvate carboxylase [Pseudomonadota bacterium]